jgi:hypothetical protein
MSKQSPKNDIFFLSEMETLNLKMLKIRIKKAFDRFFGQKSFGLKFSVKLFFGKMNQNPEK